MRICIASSGLGHVTRGVESWAEDLGRILAERGQQVVLCMGAGTANEPHERVLRCWTRESKQANRLLRLLPHRIAWRAGLGSGYAVEQSTFAWNLLRLLRKERIDILHLQDPQVAIITQRALRAGWICTRTILNHGTEESNEFQRKIAYLQHGAPWHQQQAERDGIWQPSWTMIPNFVDTADFHPGTSEDLRREFSIPADGVVTLVSSAIKTRHKRIDFLIDEFTELRRRRPDLPAWLVIAGGRTPETDSLVCKAKEQLGERVRFAIQFPRDRMPQLYRMADLFLHGSLKEMMPMALLEATASGLPCIVHHHPVMAWMIGKGGFAIDQQIEGNLSKTMIDLIENSTLRLQQGQHARTHCERLFSIETVVDQIQEYYQQVHYGNSQISATPFQTSGHGKPIV